MIKRSFVGLTTPSFEYSVKDSSISGPQKVAPSKTVRLIIESPFSKSIALKAGNEIKTGQRLCIGNAYAVSSVTGKIASVERYVNQAGKACTAVFIEVAASEQIDDAFANACRSNPRKAALEFLANAPGNPAMSLFDEGKGLDTVVICGADSDLEIVTQQQVLEQSTDAVQKGIAAIKKITGISNIVAAAPQSLMQKAGSIGASAKVISNAYPAANPYWIMKDIIGKVVPAGKCWEDLGVCILSAEAAASFGKAFDEGKVPTEKIITVVKKNGGKLLVSAKIGTLFSDILAAAGISVAGGDRITVGGPMTGYAAYAEDQAVEAGTDAIMVQDATEITPVSDYPCINCGECNRICPAKIQVNMLVRFCEAAKYQDAADLYDLDSCIECGLCSYVCVSRMPVFQYIKLAKHELARMNTAEATND